MDWLWILLLACCLLPLPVAFVAMRCCPGCQLGSDDFNRANSDDLGAAWPTQTGDPDIDSNQLLFASAGTAIFGTAHPEGDAGAQHVSVRFKRTSTSQYARVLVAWEDASNFLYAEVSNPVSSAALRLFQVAGGTTNQVGNTVTLSGGSDVGSWNTLQVCWNPADYPSAGLLRAKVILGSGQQYVNQTTVVAAGAQVGLAGDASVRMDDFYLGRMRDTGFDRCPDCHVPCAACLGGVGPDELLVSFSGFFNSPTSCSDCTDMNAGFVLQRRHDLDGTALCIWHWEGFYGVCGLSGINEVTVYLGADYVRVVATIALAPGVQQFEWLLENVTDLDCLTLDDLEIPFDWQTAQGYCDGSASTSLVTAL